MVLRAFRRYVRPASRKKECLARGKKAFTATAGVLEDLPEEKKPEGGETGPRSGGSGQKGVGKGGLGHFEAIGAFDFADQELIVCSSGSLNGFSWSCRSGFILLLGRFVDDVLVVTCGVIVTMTLIAVVTVIQKQ